MNGLPAFIPKTYIYRGGASKLGGLISERRYKRQLQKEADQRYKDLQKQRMQAYLAGKPDPTTSGPNDLSGVTDPLSARQWLISNGVLRSGANDMQVAGVREWAQTLPTFYRRVFEQALPLVQHPEMVFEEMLKQRSAPIDNRVKTEVMKAPDVIVPATVKPIRPPKPVIRTPEEVPVPKINTEPIIDIPEPPEKDTSVDPVVELWDDYFDPDMENAEPETEPEPEPEPKPAPVSKPAKSTTTNNTPAFDPYNANAQFAGINAAGFLGTKKLKRKKGSMKAYMNYVRSFKKSPGKKRQSKKQTRKAFMQYVRSFK